MSMKHLNTQTLDIHAGGRDLVFPHHENEIAQSEAYTGKPFAKYWIHHGLLTINSQKMSKSLGNFITIQDALKKFTVDDLKMFFLSAHYSSAIDYTEAKMEDMHKALQKFDILFWKAQDILSKHNFDGSRRNGTSKVDWVEQHRARFIEAMDDDFNTALAMGSLFDLINDTNRYIDTHADDADFALIVYTAVDVLESLSRDIFGLFRKEETKELSDEDEALLDQRKQARANKNFQRSDELRDELKGRGIIVEDGKEGQTWRWA
jgi:cysteinyl-tRNA synthetase